MKNKNEKTIDKDTPRKTGEQAAQVMLKGSIKAARLLRRGYKAGEEKIRELEERAGNSLEAQYRKQEAERERTATRPEAYKPQRVDLEEEGRKKDKKIKNRYKEIRSSSQFDLDSYAKERKTNNPWVTLDIGPGSIPSGLNREFLGNSSYIALEPCMNPQYATKSEVEEVFNTIKTGRPGENIELHTDIRHSITEEGLTFKGYDLPDAIANEVFISNVFDDHTIYAANNKNAVIAGEAYRMLKPGGKLIVQDRESTLVGELGDLLSTQGFQSIYADGPGGGPYYKDDLEGHNTYRRNFWHQTEKLGLEPVKEGHDSLAIMIFQKPAESTSQD